MGKVIRHSVRAVPVLHHHREAVHLVELLRIEPAEHIDAAAHRERNDEPHACQIGVVVGARRADAESGARPRSPSCTVPKFQRTVLR